MTYKGIIGISIAAILIVSSFIAGRITAKHEDREKMEQTVAVANAAVDSKSDPHDTELTRAIANAKPGDVIEVSRTKDTKGETVTVNGKKINASDKDTYLRGLSWFGASANEASMHHQGLTIDKEGNPTKIGENTFTPLDSIWYGLKKIWDIFWFIILGFVILFVILGILCLIPQTAAFALPIMTGLLSLVPILGAAWVKMMAYFKGTKPLAQQTESLVEFENNLNKYDFTPTLIKYACSNPSAAQTEIKQEVTNVFNQALDKVQDKSTKEIVRDIKRSL